MRTGVSYLGHHNPKHIITDLQDIKKLGCDDVFLAAQENDFVYLKGKLEFFPKIAKEFGLRPLVIFWGALNYFGGGKSSQFLLEHPEAHQLKKDATYHPSGCYNNPLCAKYIKNLIDRIAELGFSGYFIDEPSPTDCYCPACQALFEKMYSAKLHKANKSIVREFRKSCVINYIKIIADYVKKSYPQLETICCVMLRDKSLWKEAAEIKSLDNLGTDIYWVNEDVNVEKMTPSVKELSGICKANHKKHHQWLQAWGVKKGKELRIKSQGEILLREKPDSLYVWAYEGQIGTSEACENPEVSWKTASDILREAKNT